MSRRKDQIDHRLLYKVSELYYLQDQNQQQIADRLCLSRPKVSRLLKQAREVGVVQISIVSNRGVHTLETALESTFDLEEAVVVETENSIGQAVLKQQLGTAAAAYLKRTIADGDVIGITWGTTLQAMMQYLQPHLTHDVHVIQTLGGLGPPEAEAHAADLSRRMAQLLGASLTLLPAPGIVESTTVRNALLSDRYVRAALESFSKLKVAYVGIGALETNPIFDETDGFLTRAVYDALKNAGAVGDIAGRFFDLNGQFVSSSLDDRTIGIGLDMLRRVPRVVGMAGGSRKTNAILGALRGRFINVLITDRITASRLLGQE